jgi:hypothetical protein
LLLLNAYSAKSGSLIVFLICDRGICILRARQALAEQQAELSGIYPGNPKRATPRPTMEWMLEVFDNINLSIVYLAEQTLCQVTPLTAVQERILSLLGLPITLYTDWTVA